MHIDGSSWFRGIFHKQPKAAEKSQMQGSPEEAVKEKKPAKAEKGRVQVERHTSQNVKSGSRSANPVAQNSFKARTPEARAPLGSKHQVKSSDQPKVKLSFLERIFGPKEDKVLEGYNKHVGPGVTLTKYSSGRRDVHLVQTERHDGDNDVILGNMTVGSDWLRDKKAGKKSLEVTDMYGNSLEGEPREQLGKLVDKMDTPSRIKMLKELHRQLPQEKRTQGAKLNEMVNDLALHYGIEKGLDLNNQMKEILVDRMMLFSSPTSLIRAGAEPYSGEEALKNLSDGIGTLNINLVKDEEGHVSPRISVTQNNLSFVNDAKKKVQVDISVSCDPIRGEIINDLTVRPK